MSALDSRENPFAHVHPPYHAGFSGHPLVVMSHPRALTEAEYLTFDGLFEKRCDEGHKNIT